MWQYCLPQVPVTRCHATPFGWQKQNGRTRPLNFKLIWTELNVSLSWLPPYAPLFPILCQSFKPGFQLDLAHSLLSFGYSTCWHLVLDLGAFLPLPNFRADATQFLSNRWDSSHPCSWPELVPHYILFCLFYISPHTHTIRCGVSHTYLK